jgi:hypothetical protein
LSNYNQNAPHKKVFGAWAARPRADAQVSTSLSWDEVYDVDPDELTIATVARRHDPWATINETPQSLEPLLELHARDMSAGPLDAVATGRSQAAERASTSDTQQGTEGINPQERSAPAGFAP